MCRHFILVILRLRFVTSQDSCRRFKTCNKTLITNLYKIGIGISFKITSILIYMHSHVMHKITILPFFSKITILPFSSISMLFYHHASFHLLCSCIFTILPFIMITILPLACHPMSCIILLHAMHHSRLSCPCIILICHAHA